MIFYKDIVHPSSGRPALDANTGTLLDEGLLSSGQTSFAIIAKAIVDHGFSLDEKAVLELCRLLRG